MNHEPPHCFPRRILLAVTGLSPQVVTETVYALAVDRQQPFVPTEICLISTAKGREQAQLSLLSDYPGWFHRLRHDYALPPVRFAASDILVLSAAADTPLDDIRTPEDNEHAADFITEQVRRLTADPDSALHVSIAGGRKTMGYYLGYALSLFGRPQDRLSHVLVSEPFESNREFFYPTPETRVIPGPDGHLDASVARITIAEIPFVSLRHGLPEKLLSGHASFRETVAAARASVAPPRLVIDLTNRRVRAADRVLTLPPAELALLAVFARRALLGDAAITAPKKDVADQDWARRFLDELERIVGSPLDIPEATTQALRHGMDDAYFSQHLSKLHRHMRRALDLAAASYSIQSDGARRRRYRLALPAEAIHFGPVERDA